MDYDKLIAKANQSIGTLRSGSIFVLKNLFVGAEWENIPKGERISFGRYFKHEVQEGNIPGIVLTERTKNNSNRHKKI